MSESLDFGIRGLQKQVFTILFFSSLAFILVFSVLHILSLTKYFFLGILLAVHSVSCYFLKGLKRNHIGIELITLITVLAGVAYGAKAGAAFGALSIAADYVFSGRISYFSLVTIPSYALIGVISSLLASTSLPVLGVLMAVIYNVATSIIIFCFLGGDLDKCIRFGVTAVAFNFLIFSSFAGALLSLMV